MGKTVEFKAVNSWEDGVAAFKFAQVSLESLLRRCRNERDSESWNIFFTKFNRLIIKTIHKTFIRAGLNPYSDEDSVREIYLLIVEKARKQEKGKKGWLEDLENPAALPSWIRRSVQRTTIDWLRQQNLQKTVLTTYEEKRIRHMDEHLDLDEGIPLGETLGNDVTERLIEEKEVQEELNDVLADIEEMGEDSVLVVKCFCLFYDSLTESEIRMIAERRKTTRERVQTEVNELQNRLVKRHEERLKKENQKAIRWAKIRKWELQLKEMKKNPLIETRELQEQTLKIRRESEKLEQLMEKDKSMIKPRNKEMAALLGIPEALAKSLSVKMKRIRSMLIRQAEKRKLMEDI